MKKILIWIPSIINVDPVEVTGKSSLFILIDLIMLALLRKLDRPLAVPLVKIWKNISPENKYTGKASWVDIRIVEKTIYNITKASNGSNPAHKNPIYVPWYRILTLIAEKYLINANWFRNPISGRFFKLTLPFANFF